MNNIISNKNSIQSEEEKAEKEIIDLVIARLKSIPRNAILSIGNGDTLNVQEMIEHVRANDEEGQLIISTQLDYIRSLKDLPIDIGL